MNYFRYKTAIAVAILLLLAFSMQPAWASEQVQQQQAQTEEKGAPTAGYSIVVPESVSVGGPAGEVRIIGSGYDISLRIPETIEMRYEAEALMAEVKGENLAKDKSTEEQIGSISVLWGENSPPVLGRWEGQLTYQCEASKGASCFAAMSWKEIEEISKSGKAREVFNKGMNTDQSVEEHNCMLSGCIKECKINGETVEVNIIGFDHDPMSDGSGMAGITFGMVDCFSATKSLTTGDNAGGWEKFRIRADMQNWSVTDVDDVPIDVAVVNKSSDKGTAAGNGSFSVTADRIWMFSEKELTGSTFYFDGPKGKATAGEKIKSDGSRDMCALDDLSSQYEYYRYLWNNTVTIWYSTKLENFPGSMFDHDIPSLFKESSKGGAYFLRSCSYSVATSACVVGSVQAYLYDGTLTKTSGIVVGFCLPGAGKSAAAPAALETPEALELPEAPEAPIAPTALETPVAPAALESPEASM